jgi:ferredoxin, 2Fe-2S
MPQVTYISHTGSRHEIDVPVGRSVMEAAVQNGIDGIVAECGGSCLCATCHVYVDDAFLDHVPLDSDQDAMLDSTAAERKPNSRLSCQILMKPELAGLIVHMPESQK